MSLVVCTVRSGKNFPLPEGLALEINQLHLSSSPSLQSGAL